MALANTAVPAFPSVPMAPGVPPLLRQVGAVIDTVVLVAADAKLLVQQITGGPTWGLFAGTSPVPVLAANSVVAVDYRKEWRLATYPLEQGGFASYNKVVEPFDIRLTFAVSGAGGLLSSILSGGLIGQLISGDSSLAARHAFLVAMDAAAGSLNVYQVVTPEITYASCNIVHYDYRREDRKGATLLQIDVWLQEVRRAPSASFTTPPNAPTPAITSPQNPTSGDPTSGGTVQTTAPTPAQQAGQVGALGNSSQGNATIDLSVSQAPGSPDNAGSGVLYNQHGMPQSAASLN